jgi:hypothetical protein
MKKIFVVRKFVIASSIKEAIKIERDITPDDCWLDDDWRKNNYQLPPQRMGFYKK